MNSHEPHPHREDHDGRLHEGRPEAARERRIMVSVHIPKTAGMSFLVLLWSVFGKRKVHRDYGGIEWATDKLIQKALYSHEAKDPAEALRHACRRNKLRCIHGHFYAEKYYRLLPEADLVFWVRDPVERVISQFFHVRRVEDRDTEESRLVYEGQVNLWEYAEMEEIRNLQARRISNVPFEKFSFIGVAEHFEESVQAFSRTFNLRVKPKYARKKVNDNRQKPVLRNSRLREHIAALNKEDMDLYKRVLRSYGR